MLAQLLSLLTTWLGSHAEQTAYHSVKAGTLRGLEKALQELTGSDQPAAEWLRTGRIEPGHQERLEAPQTQALALADPEASPVPATFTRTQIHALRREELLHLIDRHGWQIDTAGNVRDIRQAVLDELGI